MTDEQKDAIRWARDVAIAGKWEHVKALGELLAAGASEGQAGAALYHPLLGGVASSTTAANIASGIYTISTKDIDVDCTRVVDEEFWNLTYSVADQTATACGHHVEDERNPEPIGHWWTFDREALSEFAKCVADPSAEIAALRERIAGMEKAQAFAGIVLGTYRADLGDLDGFWLQEQAEAHGMIEERTATVRCGEGCACAEVTTFPTSCFFITEAGQAAIDAAIAKEPK